MPNYFSRFDTNSRQLYQFFKYFSLLIRREGAKRKGGLKPPQRGFGGSKYLSQLPNIFRFSLIIINPRNSLFKALLAFVDIKQILRSFDMGKYRRSDLIDLLIRRLRRQNHRNHKLERSRVVQFRLRIRIESFEESEYMRYLIHHYRLSMHSGSVGIEPTTTASETDVIPFHHDPIRSANFLLAQTYENIYKIQCILQEIC